MTEHELLQRAVALLDDVLDAIEARNGDSPWEPESIYAEARDFTDAIVILKPAPPPPPPPPPLETVRSGSWADVALVLVLILAGALIVWAILEGVTK